MGIRATRKSKGPWDNCPTAPCELIETAADARAFTPIDAAKLAFVTQTTLSVDDTAEIVSILNERFPGIAGPMKEDICYATTNRQAAVKAIAPNLDCLLVIGAPNSSNSVRLVEVAERAGCSNSVLIQRASDMPWHRLDGARTVGITAGASAPEQLVNEVVDALRSRFDVSVEIVSTATENIAFNVPRELRDVRAPGSTSSLAEKPAGSM